MERRSISGGLSARNEIVEVRGGYVIHRYCFADHSRCDFHVAGPRLRHVVFDVEPGEAEQVVDQLRALIDEADHPVRGKSVRPRLLRGQNTWRCYK